MTTALELQHFAVLELSQTLITDGIEITCITNNPCHLTLYYTDKQPVRHSTSLVKRGVALPWGAYFCFVAWKSIEQQEAGDTLIHTFEITPWTYCQTKWLSFRGTVAGELSPSVTAIIKKHYSSKLYEFFDQPPNTASTTNEVEIWYGQTFTPLQAHAIVGVRLLLGRTQLINTLTASIRATNPEGDPIPPDLTAGTIDGNILPIHLDRDWFYISLNPLNLEIYTKYAICIRAQNIGLTWWGAWPGDYPRGNACASPDEGAIWYHYDWDYMFEEWGTPL